jgi:Cu2+-containing amine oxidase
LTLTWRTNIPASVALLSADTPVLRHYSYSYQFYGAIPGASLVVRMVSEINNYDYIADLILSNDGMLEVKVVTSG